MKRYVLTLLMCILLLSAFSQTKISKTGSLIFAERLGIDAQIFNPGSTKLSVSGNQLIFTDKISLTTYLIGDWDELMKADSTYATSLTDAVDYIGDMFFSVPLETNIAVPVNIQDQHSPLIIAYFSLEVGADTLAEATEIGDYFITVGDTTGLRVGGYLSIFSVPDNRFYLANILTRVVDTLGVDTPLDFAFPVGSFVTSGDKDMNVDGSVTPVIYGLRNTEAAIGSAFDITRIIITCMTNTAVDLSKFGDIADGLTRGLVMRKKDGVYRNVFNVKTNGELASLMYDWTPYLATNPVQGQDGFVGRLTFAGQNKMGVTLRIEPGEDIQVLIQDNLTSLPTIFIIAEGHTVTD